jgi:phage terminase large subunit
VNLKVNKTFLPVLNTKARYIHAWGGRGRGGSHFGTDFFLWKQQQPQYFRGYFMREIYGDIRGSLWQDYIDRIDENPTITPQSLALNQSTMSSVHLPTGNIIASKGFKKSSGKQTAKLKSLAGATHVLIEEMEENDEMDYNQLDDSFRTTKGDIHIIGIFNPPHKNHWIIRRWYNLFPAEDFYGPEFKGYYVAIPKEDDSLLSIHSTYLDNRNNINLTTQQNYERYKETNFEYYATMIKGLVSEGAKGVIYKNWKPITYKEFRRLPYPSFYGLDFGFSNDPAAMIEIKAHNDTLWKHEVFYKRELTNPNISSEFEANGILKSDEIYADSAEPKSIAELQQMGWNVIPAVKGPDSIEAGVKFILSKEVYYTENSTNLIYEKDNYTYALDSNKEPTRKPIDKYNHLMDGDRYATYTKLAVPEEATFMIDGHGNVIKF